MYSVVDFKGHLVTLL